MPSDTVARLGGDEFALLMHLAAPADVRSIRSKILTSVRRTLVIGTHRLQPSASIGLASCFRWRHRGKLAQAHGRRALQSQNQWPQWHRASSRRPRAHADGIATAWVDWRSWASYKPTRRDPISVIRTRLMVPVRVCGPAADKRTCTRSSHRVRKTHLALCYPRFRLAGRYLPSVKCEVPRKDRAPR